MRSIARTWVDRGGTFTDVVQLTADGRVLVRKVPSDRAVVGQLAPRGALTFGTTVATNALLERKGVRTLLVVTRGFADLPHIGDMSRPDLFDIERTWPTPLHSHVAEVVGRIDTEGEEVEPLVLPATWPLDEIDAVAIVLLNSHRNPAHEQAVANAIRQARPELFVTLGHRISPETGYLARIETTLVDAAITPVLRQAMARDAIPRGSMAMRSDGGLSPAADFRAPDAILSGPAGGVLAVAAVAEQAGFERAVGLDMGGTSTDVCRVDRGTLPRREGDVRVAGVRLRRPMLEVETIAAGGGSVLWSDGRQLGVGPHSAGADPGPQCYGRGGPPTLTDAALVAGLVRPEDFDPPLDPTSIELPGPAQAFLDIARDAMAAAVRRIATARGIDLSDHALVSYGGAAGQHACEVARRLGIHTVLVHPCSAVLSAFGQSLARREDAAVRALWRPFPTCWPDVQAAWAELEAELPALDEVHRTVEIRHVGTDHALQITANTAEEAEAAFVIEHRRRYGFDREHPLEVLNVWVRVRGDAPSPPAVDADPWDIGDREVVGPAVIASPTTSVEVPAGWRAHRIDGLLQLHYQQAGADTEPRSATQRTPLGVALWGQRFMAVAEEAGAVLRRLARSVNIRERLDFSCAVFDRDGHLIANAPHIPVHLGAMGETVRDLIRHHPDLEDGQAWLTNDPDAGGSHLPDLTVVTPVIVAGHRWFVASRGHHVDVGGITPGSMPPHSTTLEEEGFVVRHAPLLVNGALNTDAIGPCRDPETVLADLEAQIASNRRAAHALRRLGPPDVIDAWMSHLQDVAAEAVVEAVSALANGAARDDVDGIPLVLSLTRTDPPTAERLVVDLTGTGGVHRGNRNAPPAVVRAAVLYSVRVLVGRDMPLNEGSLRPVVLRLPAPSLVSPPSGAAVAGGNVETSQALVDLVLRAAGHMAASQGTMNNLTLGGDGWSFYETIGGGQGASPRGAGPSGRQVHMTNTRATDPEVLEARLPLRVRRFCYRRGSGGHGAHQGGDGLIREIEVLVPSKAALLASRRHSGSAGLGGSDGLPGSDYLRRDGLWAPWDGGFTELRPGDRVFIATPGGGGWTEPPPIDDVEPATP